MHRFIRTPWVLLGSVILFSCGEDDPITLDDLSENVEAEISPFIQSFLDEAAVQGFDFNLKGFEATFSEDDIDDNENICGQASPFSESRNFITIRRSERCWIGQPSSSKEALVFHELGHALLDRPHRDDRFDNGLVKSIMETGTLGPYNQFTPLLTSYLVSELFDETFNDAPWAFDKTEETIIDINSDLEESAQGWFFFNTQNLLLRSAVTGVRTETAAASGSFSLGLQVTQQIDETLFWRFRTDDLTNIPETADIIIEVMFRMQDVEGGGVAIAGGLDKDGQLLTFASTETEDVLVGTTVFQKKTITVPYFPNTTAVASVILAFLPNTTGLVFFDDIQMRAVYNPAFGPV